MFLPKADYREEDAPKNGQHDEKAEPSLTLQMLLADTLGHSASFDLMPQNESATWKKQYREQKPNPPRVIMKYRHFRHRRCGIAVDTSRWECRAILSKEQMAIPHGEGLILHAQHDTMTRFLKREGAATRANGLVLNKAELLGSKGLLTNTTTGSLQG
jgi:hypothetical protein